jgi:hypothetical protein
MEAVGQRHSPAALHPKKDTVRILQEAVRPQGQCGRLRKMSPLAGFQIQTAQSVASCYTDYTLLAHMLFTTDQNKLTLN